MLLFPRWKEICSTPLHNAIALERSLIEVARQCPDLTVSIRLGDLIEANQSLVEEALMRLEKSVAESRTEIYLSRTKVMEMLEVASATLWRWEMRPRTAIRRRQETLPSVRHPTAPEPLMLLSAKR